MEKIKELTKNTLFRLREENLSTIPENYFIEFRKQAQLLEIKLKEFQLFDKVKELLTTNEKEITQINTFNDLAIILSQRVNEEELIKLIKIFKDILKPSVESNLKEEIENFIFETLENPKNLISDDSINKLKDISRKRVHSDRKILKNTTDDIIKLTSLIDRYFDKTLNAGENSTDDILKIKDELITLNISDTSHKELKNVQIKLVDTIHKIESSIKMSNKIINENKIQFNTLHKQIEKLQEELTIAREEKHIDFLTNMLNRRAYDEEIKKIEEKYSEFNNNYAIIFYDIDYFKNINDEYGHTCGDAILKNFAAILKKLTRKEDIIARYGGEEFIALVNYFDEIELEGYLKRVKRTVYSTNFIYKEKSINIRFSAGVSYRNKYDSYLDAKKKADELLYEAKNKGRNKIIFDNKIEF
ncbi:MAG: GGDEF domain-containing protein [Aliarcobacter sp.]|nr:GGDEF domain-containing protein [Aliarcobacter sp.]